jgi:hypothetical protein
VSVPTFSVSARAVSASARNTTTTSSARVMRANCDDLGAKRCRSVTGPRVRLRV